MGRSGPRCPSQSGPKPLTIPRLKALVTGGGGFLGSAIVRLLRARGDDVIVVARGDYPQLQSLGVTARCVRISPICPR